MGALSSQAQWVSQDFVLKAGWNAIYLHVDSSHVSLQDLVGADTNNPISDIWLWNPPPVIYQLPDADNSHWSSWCRTNSEGSLLQTLVGNAAYLVNVGTNAGSSNFTWSIKGRPMPPNCPWTSAGINLVGFQTVPAVPPTFDNFLAGASNLYTALKVTPSSQGGIYRYVGGAMQTNPPANPALLATDVWRSERVNRYQAYWICVTNVDNDYFGPFAIDITKSRGLDFSDSINVQTFRIRNLMASNLTVTLSYADSETPPDGQAGIAGLAPLLVRGSLNTSNLTYGSIALTPAAPYVCELAGSGLAGSEAEIVLGLNRAAMGGVAGDFYAGVLSLTDSKGYTKVDVPVAALTSDRGGLWVGYAAITQVGEYLKTYAVDTNGATATDTNGAYIVTNTATRLGSVPRSFPLRLIVHNPTNGNSAVLLQHVFCGLDAETNSIVATAESALGSAYRASARRISASHLPWSAANTPWAFDHNLEATSLTVRVTTDYADQAANPFLHAYHPDHDNLDVDFQPTLGPGAESYTIQRDITLTCTPPAVDFDSCVSWNATISGSYSEALTLLGLNRAAGAQDQRTFHVSGAFRLTRITDVPTLTTPP